jgi:hypothetical protein
VEALERSLEAEKARSAALEAALQAERFAAAGREFEARLGKGRFDDGPDYEGEEGDGEGGGTYGDVHEEGYDQWLHGAVRVTHGHVSFQEGEEEHPHVDSGNPVLDAMRARKEAEAVARKANWDAAARARAAVAEAEAQPQGEAGYHSLARPVSARLPSRIPRPAGSAGARPSTVYAHEGESDAGGDEWEGLGSPTRRAYKSRGDEQPALSPAEAIAAAVEAGAYWSPGRRSVSSMRSPAPASTRSESRATAAQEQFSGPVPYFPRFAAQRAPSFSSPVPAPLPSTAGHGGSTTSSNRQRVVQALQSLCLAGPHRAEELHAALTALKSVGGAATNFLILLASSESLTYRGLYSYEPSSGTAARLHGHGPARLNGAIHAGALAAGEVGPADPRNAEGLRKDGEAAAAAHWVDGAFKYSTSGRVFVPIRTRAVTITTDALTLRAKAPLGARK